MEGEKHLEKEELFKVFNDFELNQDKLEVNVIFTNSNFNRKEKYKVYTLLADEEDMLPTIKQCLIYLKKQISERSFEKYDLELAMDDTVQIVEKDKVVNGIELLLKMAEAIPDDSKVLDNKVKLDTLDFIIILLYDPINKKSVYLLEKYIHPTSKYKTTLKFILNGSKAVPFEKEIITVNSTVDAILYDNYYYIYNRKSFNSIFNFKDVFYKIIHENQQLIKESNLFANTEMFLKDCIEDGRYLPRLTKVVLSKGFETVKDNKAKLPQMKSHYKLSFGLTTDGRIEYIDKKEITDILNVLLDHFVISALTDKKMLAKAIEKYEM